jgi:pyrimidine-nucleoside phosphorylase
MRLGAGRIVKEDVIDHAVGIVCLRKRGDRVAAGDTLAEIYAQDEASAQGAVAEVKAAYELTDEEPKAVGVILETLT